jgi:hypothetical protein
MINGSSNNPPPAKQPHIGTPYGHAERPTMCTKGRYRAMAHRNNRHSAQNGLFRAAIWQNQHGVRLVVHRKGHRARWWRRGGVIFWEGGRNWGFKYKIFEKDLLSL